jgi:hypothetical protein
MFCIYAYKVFEENPNTAGTDWFVFMPYCILGEIITVIVAPASTKELLKALLVLDTMAGHAFAYAGYILS